MSDETRHPFADSDTNALIGAALIGAAIGAGLGLLASRAAESDPRSMLVRAARRRLRKQLGRGAKAAASARSAASGTLADARSVVADFASHARDSFEDVLQREVRQLRKAARRQGRRFGI